jgi:hypothetical protein
MSIVEIDEELCHKAKPSEYFELEINLIDNRIIKSWLINFLDTNVPKFEYERESSSTGKYHPESDKGFGGNGRHIKTVVKVLNDCFRPARPDLHWSRLIAAAILHDLLKYDEESSQYTSKDHGEKMAEKLLETRTHLTESDDDVRLSEEIKEISELVKYHMGQWSVEFSSDGKPDISLAKRAISEEGWILHYADMVASRTWMGTDAIFMSK